MADIILVCPGCGKQVSVSEYVDAAIPCPQCGRPLDKQAAPAETGTKPKLASMLKRSSLVSAAAPPEAASESAPAIPPAPAPQERHTSSRVQSEFRQWLHYVFAWLVFLGLAALFLWWQWQGQADAQVMAFYKTARWVFAGGAWLAIILAAFRDTWLQGLLNLCIPPYTLYYAFNRLDHFYLRAVFAAVLVMLAGEFYFLPHQTVLHLAQQAIGDWTAGIRRLITHAGHRITDT